MVPFQLGPAPGSFHDTRHVGLLVLIRSVEVGGPLRRTIGKHLLGTGRLDGLAVRIKSTAKPWISKTSLAVRSVSVMVPVGEPRGAHWCLKVSLFLNPLVPRGACWCLLVPVGSTVWRPETAKPPNCNLPISNLAHGTSSRQRQLQRRARAHGTALRHRQTLKPLPTQTSGSRMMITITECVAESASSCLVNCICNGGERGCC